MTPASRAFPPRVGLPPVAPERWVVGTCGCGHVVRVGYAHGWMGQRLLCARCYEAALAKAVAR